MSRVTPRFPTPTPAAYCRPTQIPRFARPNSTLHGESTHNAVPLRSKDSRVHSSAQLNHCCAHNPDLSPHRLVQLARAQFRPTATTPNRNEQLNMYKNCVIIAAHNASQ